MEWMGKEDVPMPQARVWQHVHRDDQKMHVHSEWTACIKGVPAEEESRHAWCYHAGHISSVAEEAHVQYLAKQYPQAIYFFADSVPHPNS